MKLFVDSSDVIQHDTLSTSVQKLQSHWSILQIIH